MKLINTLLGKPAPFAAAETEEALRAAMVEPFAPGEEDSYRLLMGVIADDLRLRQPAPARSMWAWLPATSVAAAATILGVVAYDAGVHSGYNLPHPPETVIVSPRNGNAKTALVPHGVYVPKTSLPAPSAPQTSTNPLNVFPSLNRGGGATLAPIMIDSLTPDQKDLLRAADEAMDHHDWKSAAEHFEHIADADATNSAAVGALEMAAAIHGVYLADNAGAQRIYRKEVQVCQDQMNAATDADVKAHLQTLLDRAKANAGLVPGETPGNAAAPAKN